MSNLAQRIGQEFKTLRSEVSNLDADTLDGNHASAFQAAGTYNTIIGTDLDIDTSGATVIDTLTMTDGVITGHSTRALTASDIGALGATAKAADSDKLDGVNSTQFLRSDTGDTFSGGLLSINNTAGSEIANTSGIHGLQIMQPTAGSDASMTFHVSGDTACHFGLDGGTNKLSVGGWSMGANSYAIYHEGNKPSPADIGAAASSHTHSYVPLTGGTITGDLTVNNTLNVRGALDLADNDILRFGTGDDCEFFCNGSHMYMDLNAGIGNFYIRDGSTTRFTFDDAGHFTATGNVTAYSDKRLKTNITLIDNALNKVCTLSGYTFDRTDIDVKQTGVIAQEVQEVLPEAVIEDENGMLSVNYGSMVGILIESIKELKAEIEELKGK